MTSERKPEEQPPTMDPPPPPPVHVKPRLVHGGSPELFAALKTAGFADENTRRVVIDMPVHGMVTVFVEKYADSRVIDVVTTLDGIEIKSITAPKCASANCGHMIQEHVQNGCISNFGCTCKGYSES